MPTHFQQVGIYLFIIDLARFGIYRGFGRPEHKSGKHKELTRYLDTMVSHYVLLSRRLLQHHTLALLCFALVDY